MDFFVENSIYVTLVIAGMILLGLLVYLNRIEARLRKLEGEKDQ